MIKKGYLWAGAAVLALGAGVYFYSKKSAAASATQSNLAPAYPAATLPSTVSSGAIPYTPSTTSSGLNAALLSAIGQSLTTPAQSVSGTTSASPQGAQGAPAYATPPPTQCPAMTYSGVNGACTSIFLNATDV